MNHFNIFLMAVMTLGLLGVVHADSGNTLSGTPASKYEKATFAGGCFWCMVPPFENLDGVISVTSGYTGGTEKDPAYESVSSGRTGHAEAIEILYDPAKISYGELLKVFWRNIDPTRKDAQFADVGSQYRTAVFYHNEEQRRLAAESKQSLESSGKYDKPIVTEITPAGPFYKAEAYHQDYHKKNPIRYKIYRHGSGRDQYLEKVWGEEE
jgi:peptide-methionine (S)-S-oxide reductase